MKSLFPLAVYTADHGLEWSYPKGEISYGELDQCRKAFGRLPDFDAGDPGFEGVLVTPKHLFVVHCQNVPHRDFRNRNATYLAATWVTRAEAASVDCEALLAAPELRRSLTTFPSFFEAEATASGSRLAAELPRQLPDFRTAATLAARLPEGATAALKRRDGESAVACRYTVPSESVEEKKPVSPAPAPRVPAAPPVRPAPPAATEAFRTMRFLLLISLIANILLFLSIWQLLRRVPVSESRTADVVKIHPVGEGDLAGGTPQTNHIESIPTVEDSE